MTAPALLHAGQPAATAASARVASARVASARVDGLLAAMTLDEKIALIHGATEAPASYQGQAGYVPGVARLGIPPLRLADGPPGVLTREVSTALPSTLALAASFSVADARSNGVVIGRDARALGIDLVLEPFINIYRDPAWTRSYNTYGEDPLLSGQIGAALVRGIQGQHVMSQAKHYVAFDGANDVRVDEQALHEIYAAPFAAVVDAGVSSIMCAYNRINGPYACGSDALLNGLLRQEMGFQGFVTSDWGATHAAEFINAGLDLEMPGELRVGPDREQLMTSYFSGTELTLVPTKSTDQMGFGPRGRIPEEDTEAHPTLGLGMGVGAGVGAGAGGGGAWRRPRRKPRCASICGRRCRRGASPRTRSRRRRDGYCCRCSASGCSTGGRNRNQSGSGGRQPNWSSRTRAWCCAPRRMARCC